MTVNDGLQHRLTLSGFTGSLSDNLRDWLVSKGGQGTTSDMWEQYFDSLLIPDGQHNDRKLLWLQSLGFLENDLTDAWYKFAVTDAAMP